MASSMEETAFTPVTGQNTTPMNHATIAAPVQPHSQNMFTAINNDDSAPAKGTPNKDDDFALAKGTSNDGATACEDGGSQPLIDEITPIDNALTGNIPTGGTTLVTAFAKHNRVMISAIANIIAPPDMNKVVPTPEVTIPENLATATTATGPTLAELMTLLQHNHKTVLDQLTAINGRMDTADNDNRKLRAAIDAKADSMEITCLDKRMGTMAATVALTVHNEIEATIGSKVLKTLEAIHDLKANLQL
jgi:hypothetical protein